MPDNLVGELRRSAAIMTYAPGAIIDMRADGGPVSGVSAGLEEWDRSAPLSGNLKYQKIIERRLCKKLGKKYFRLPPVLEDDARIPGTDALDPAALVIRRFPEWLQCPVCETMRPARKWANDPGRAYRYCAACSHGKPGGEKVFVIPVRFATACLKGHLEEFPWNFWVSHKPGCAKGKQQDNLKLESKGAGLAGLVVSCPDCGERRSLDGAFRESALTGLRCRGGRPWLRSNDADCDCRGDDGTYRVVQRGASNLYYPVLESAIDIPPWTRTLERILGDYWDWLAGIEDFEERVHAIEVQTGLKQILEAEAIEARDVARRFEELKKDMEQADLSDLRIDEYRVFTSGVDENDPEFEIHREAIPPGFERLLNQVVRVSRLREVRVVKGFTRIKPPFDSDETELAPLSVGPLEWLPAIEVRGEGVFVQLGTERLREWESREDVRERVARAEVSWSAEWAARYPDKPKPYVASARRLLVHSLAHALVRQLTLECGYSSASLRERLYIGDEADGMAAVLIYTATPDSDGTLGGLQRRAMPDLLGPTLVGALRSSQWCSSDPLCIAGDMAAPESHSVAACHSCMLVPETSCELHNRFLDRALLVGTDVNPGLGFFSRVLSEGR